MAFEKSKKTRSEVVSFCALEQRVLFSATVAAPAPVIAFENLGVG